MSKVAIITGATRGIGRAIAVELARHDVNLVINYKEDEDSAKKTMEELALYKIRAILVRADVSSATEVKQMMAKVKAEFGQIDFLINNAGIVRDKMLHNLSDDDWKSVLEVNLDSVFFCIREAVPHMKEKQFGKIINIASIVGQTGALGQTNYAASKAGIIGLTKASALELAKFNITINAICPGYTNTAMLASVPAEKLEKLKEKIPLRRFAEAAEIAKLARFLLLEADYITGQEININGGLYV